MKGQVAAEVAAAIALAESGWRPERGALKLVITADEEMGAALGAQWLCAEHPEAVRSDLVVNEGGGAAFELGGRRFYTLCVGEKGVNRFQLRARGRAGHASVPALGDNALLKLAPALDPLSRAAAARADARRESRSSATLLGEDLAGAGAPQLESALERLRSLSPALASYVAEPMLRVTFVPTRGLGLEQGQRDPLAGRGPRRLPGPARRRHAREAEDRLAELLGPLRAELEVEFTETRHRQQLAARRAVRRDDRRDASPSSTRTATLVPIVMAGFSDSHWFRKAFDAATVYGFCPQRKLGLFEAAPLIHSADERAAVGDIEMAATFYADLCRRVLGESTNGSTSNGSNARSGARAPAPRRDGAPQRSADPRPEDLGGRSAQPRWRDRGRVGPEADARPRPARDDAAAARARCGSPRRWRSSRWPAAACARRACRSRTPGVVAATASRASRSRACCAGCGPATVGREARDRGPRDAPGAERAARPGARLLPRGRAQGDRRLRAGTSTRRRSRRSTSAAART